MHKTQWVERQYLLWVCSGCCSQCMVVCKYPIQGRECNGSNETILDITAMCKQNQQKEVKDEKEQKRNFAYKVAQGV